MKKIIVCLNFYRLWVPFIYYLFGKQSTYIREDLKCISYALPKYKVNLFNFGFALVFNMPYRAVVQYRLKGWSGYIIKLLFPNKRQIELGGTIGHSLTIFHGQGTVLYPYIAGDNLSVWQNVTVGRNPSHSKMERIHLS